MSNTKKIYVPPHKRNSFKGIPEVFKPLNSWKKRHYVVMLL
jgi:hypothetical protein